LEKQLKGAGLQWLGEGIALSISDQLDTQDLSAVDRVELLRLVEGLDLPPGAPLSRGSMIRVAQNAGADFLVMGVISGREQNLKISVRVLDVKALKLGGEMVANGPFTALTQMENELAWLILSNNSLAPAYSRERFQGRTRKVPNTAYAYYVQSFEASGEDDKLHLLLKAVEIYRDFPEAQFRIGSLYFNRGNCGSAIPHLALGRGSKSTQLDGDFMRGTCYIQVDQPTLAIQTLWNLLQVSRSAEVLNNLGVAYLRKGDTALAVSSFMDARNLARTDSTVLLNVSLIRHLQGNDTAARSVLEDAVQLHPKNGMLQFLTGIVLKTQGDNERALAAIAKARELGVNTEKLQAEDPKLWSQVLLNFEARQNSQP
jgi:tetratricopeptide (TPR) repeat protein